MMQNLVVSADIVLTEIVRADAPDLFALVDRNRGHLQEWLPWLNFNTSVADSLEFINSSQKLAATKTGLVTIIRFKNEPVGVIGYNCIDRTHRTCEIGYWIDENHQGVGIVMSSTRKLVDYAFAELKLNKVDIPVATKNTRSRAIPTKLGFTIEGVSRDAEWLYDHFVSHTLYSMLKTEWELNALC
ncbi:MAG: ribosomal-protein-serine acetyltransferase [Limisphaerales bacterium]|jgi:ribosomal-protein-serine acetyltransferase